MASIFPTKQEAIYYGRKGIERQQSDINKKQARVNRLKSALDKAEKMTA